MSNLHNVIYYADLERAESEPGDAQIAVETISLLTATLDGSPTNRQNFSQVGGKILLETIFFPTEATTQASDSLNLILIRTTKVKNIPQILKFSY